MAGLTALALWLVGAARVLPVVASVPPQPDLAGYDLAGAAINAGGSPYDPTALDRAARASGLPFDAAGYTFAYPYLYPPFFAGLARALAVLPYALVQGGWLLANVALTAAVAFALAWRCGLRSAAPAATLLALVAPPTLETLLSGQFNALLFALLRAALCLSSVAGVMIGLAAAIKLFPAMALLAFLRAGRGGQVAVAALTGLLAVALGIALAGWGPTVDFARVVLPALSSTVLQPENQSVHAGVGRLFTSAVHRFLAFTPADPQPVAFPAVVDLPVLAGPVTWTLVVVVVVASIVALWRRPPRGAGGRRTAPLRRARGDASRLGPPFDAARPAGDRAA